MEQSYSGKPKHQQTVGHRSDCVQNGNWNERCLDQRQVSNRTNGDVFSTAALISATRVHQDSTLPLRWDLDDGGTHTWPQVGVSGSLHDILGWP